MSAKAGESLSLETLLEAAKFVEHNNSPDSQTRVPTPPEFHHYAKSAPSPESRERLNSNSERSEKDESGADDGKDKRRMGGYGTREVHNKLEKNRRAHLKDCFENLKSQVPHLDEKNLKTSNLAILRGALKHIQVLKKREVELEQEVQQLAYIKIKCQQRLSHLQGELCAMDIDMARIIAAVDEDDNHSVSTATADEDGPILSDVEDDEPPAKIVRTLLMTPTTVTLTPAVAHTEDVLISKTDKVEVRSVVTTHKLPSIKLPTALSGTLLTAQSSGSVSKRPQTIASLTAGQSLKTIPRSIGLTMSQAVTKPSTVVTIPLGTPLTTITKAVHPSTTTHIGQLLLQKQISQVSTQVAGLPGKTTISMATKTPVTQILQQAITQRQQQLQQQQQQQQLQHQQQAQLVKQLHQSGLTGMVQAQLAPQLTVAVANSQPQLITVAPGNTIRPLTAATLKPMTTAQIRPAGITLNQMLPNMVTSATPMLAGSAPNTLFTQSPSLMTLNKLISAALTTTTTTTTSNTAVTASLVPSPASTINSQAVTIANPGANMATMKHILTLPLTHIPATQIMSQSALNQFMAQAINKNNATQFLTTTNAAGLTQIIAPAASHSGGLQASLQTIPLMSPMTVMSPAGIQMAQTAGLQQGQLGVSSQILKPLGQIPILQSLPLKPVVMVTMPNMVVSTTAAPTMTLSANPQPVQVNLAVTTRPS